MTGHQPYKKLRERVSKERRAASDMATALLPNQQMGLRLAADHRPGNVQFPDD